MFTCKILQHLGVSYHAQHEHAMINVHISQQIDMHSLKQLSIPLSQEC